MSKYKSFRAGRPLAAGDQGCHSTQGIWNRGRIFSNRNRSCSPLRNWTGTVASEKGTWAPTSGTGTGGCSFRNGNRGCSFGNRDPDPLSWHGQHPGSWRGHGPRSQGGCECVLDAGTRACVSVNMMCTCLQSLTWWGIMEYQNYVNFSSNAISSMAVFCDAL